MPAGERGGGIVLSTGIAVGVDAVDTEVPRKARALLMGMPRGVVLMGLVRGGIARPLGDGVRPMKPRAFGLALDARFLLVKSSGAGRIILSLCPGEWAAPGVVRPGVRTPCMVWLVWCGVVSCGVVWRGVVWHGVAWCGVAWCRVVSCGVLWYGMVWCGVVWYRVVWCGMVWCGVAWRGAVWCGVVLVFNRLQ